ncbi:MAG: glycosyltransferase family 4 protein [Caldilineales bacterium]
MTGPLPTHGRGPRVLMIGPEPRVGGGISAVAGMILDSSLPERCQMTYLAEGTRAGGLAKVRRWLSALAREVAMLARRQVDVVHLQVGGGGSFYRHILYLALARLAGRPVLFHWHLPGDAGAATEVTGGNPLQGWLVRRTLRSATVVLVLSPGWQAALAGLVPSGAGKHPQLVALPNPVDCAAIRPPADPGQRSDATVLFLGDFSPRKGVRDLLAAAPAVLAQHPDARFAITGGEPPADVAAQAAPLGEAVTFPGWVRGPEKLALLQKAALLALPSYAEGVPIAVLEAMAAGLPVVTTPVGGIPDLIIDGCNGLLVQPGDVSGLAAAINRLLADPALRTSAGDLNRQQVVADYDVPRYVDRLLAIYSSCRS